VLAKYNLKNTIPSVTEMKAENWFEESTKGTVNKIMTILPHKSNTIQADV
jgi:hypothetical protein